MKDIGEFISFYSNSFSCNSSVVFVRFVPTWISDISNRVDYRFVELEMVDSVSHMESICHLNVIDNNNIDLQTKSNSFQTSSMQISPTIIRWNFHHFPKFRWRNQSVKERFLSVSQCVIWKISFFLNPRFLFLAFCHLIRNNMIKNAKKILSGLF